MSNLPAIPLYQGADVALSRFAAAVKANVDALAGRGGDKTDAAVTVASNAPVQKVIDQLNTPKRASSGSDYTIDLGGGLTASIGIEELATKLMGTAALKGLTTSTTAAATTSATTNNSPSPADRLITASIDRINATLTTLQSEIDDLNRLNTGGTQIAIPPDLDKLIKSAKYSADTIQPQIDNNQDGLGHFRSIADVVSKFRQWNGPGSTVNNSDARAAGLYIFKGIRVKVDDWDITQTYGLGQLANAVLKLWVSANYSGFDGIRANYTGADTNTPVAALGYDTLGHNWSIHDTITGRTKYQVKVNYGEHAFDAPCTIGEIGADARVAQYRLDDLAIGIAAIQEFLNSLHGFDLYINGIAEQFGIRIAALEAWVAAH